jgi:hypothetical protein
MRRPTAHVHASRCGCLFGHMHACSRVTVLFAATASTRRAQQMEFACDAGARGPSGGRTTEGRNENMRLRALRRVCITAVDDVFRATQRGMRLLEIEMRIESRPSFEKRARRACERLWTEGVTCRSEKSHFEGDDR